MNKQEWLCEDVGEELMFWEGLDDAIVGTTLNKDCATIVVYDHDKCIQCLMEHGMNHIDAIEFFDYNILGAYIGELTPEIIRTVHWNSYYHEMSSEQLCSNDSILTVVSAKK